MAAEVIDPEDLYERLQAEAQGEELLAEQPIHGQALSDYRNMLHHMRRAPKRKATVAGIVPAELLLLGMGGVKVSEAEPHRGWRAACRGRWSGFDLPMIELCSGRRKELERRRS